MSKEQKRRTGTIARKRFLEAYEFTFGNVKASCKYAGISRSTFYRWMKSDSSILRRFQERVKCTYPQELRMDLLEGALKDLVDKGNAEALIFLMKMYSRPWPEEHVPLFDVKAALFWRTFGTPNWG